MIIGNEYDGVKVRYEAKFEKDQDGVVWIRYGRNWILGAAFFYNGGWEIRQANNEEMEIFNSPTEFVW